MAGKSGGDYAKELKGLDKDFVEAYVTLHINQAKEAYTKELAELHKNKDNPQAVVQYGQKVLVPMAQECAKLANEFKETGMYDSKTLGHLSSLTSGMYRLLDNAKANVDKKSRDEYSKFESMYQGLADGFGSGDTKKVMTTAVGLVNMINQMLKQQQGAENAPEGNAEGASKQQALEKKERIKGLKDQMLKEKQGYDQKKEENPPEERE